MKTTTSSKATMTIERRRAMAARGGRPLIVASAHHFIAEGLTADNAARIVEVNADNGHRMDAFRLAHFLLTGRALAA